MRASSSLDVKGGHMNEWEKLVGAPPLNEMISIAKAILVSGLMSGVPTDVLLDPGTSVSEEEAEAVCIAQQLYAEQLGLA